MKKRQFIEFVVMLILIFGSVITLGILLYLEKIPIRFGSEIMEIFGLISEYALYGLIFILFLNTLTPLFKQKKQRKIEKFVFTTIYILLGLTIISVGAPILVWLIALLLTINLVYFTITKKDND